MTQVGDAYTVAYLPPPDLGGGSSQTVMAGFFYCDHCRAPSEAMSVRTDQTSRGGLSDKDWFAGKMTVYEEAVEYTWYPAHAVGKEFPDVPEHIASAADEAYRCHSIGAYRGAGALARAVVEATAKEKGITSGNLHSKIAELETRQLVRPMVREAADEVRHMGNDVAHGDFVDPVEEVESSETLALMAELLAEVYQAPAQLARRRQARQARQAKQT